MLVKLFADAVRKALRSRAVSDVEVADMSSTEVAEKAPEPFADVFAGEGVYATPTPITAGEDVQIWYSGLLSRNGAKQVYLHSGVGPGAWQQVREIKMTESSAGVFTCSLQAADGGRLEFCFHDGAGHWDNNGGRNWSYAIHNGLLQ